MGLAFLRIGCLLNLRLLLSLKLWYRPYYLRLATRKSEVIRIFMPLHFLYGLVDGVPSNIVHCEPSFPLLIVFALEE